MPLKQVGDDVNSAGVHCRSSLFVPITVEQIKPDYPIFFSAEIQYLEGGRLVAEEYGLRELPPEHPIAELLNSHPHYFDYLLQNGHGITFEERKSLWSDSSSYGSRFVGLLQDDSTFNADFLPVVKAFLDSRGMDLVGYQE